MKALVAALVALTLAACATVQKVDSGEQSAGERLLVSLKGPWNKVSAPGMGPAQIWTMEGLPIDQLLIYSGIKNDEAVAKAAPGSGRKDYVFRSAMQPDEIVSLFEGMFTRDGSSFKLTKLEPTAFGGAKGFRFEYTLIRKADNVELSGLGYGTVDHGELFAFLYIAPKLTFFSRHQGHVNEMARSARLKM
jgi:hypothetical protein